MQHEIREIIKNHAQVSVPEIVSLLRTEKGIDTKPNYLYYHLDRLLRADPFIKTMVEEKTVEHRKQTVYYYKKPESPIKLF